MRILTLDDILDTYSKIVQRGYGFFISKFTLNKDSRAISAFDKSSEQTSNWWIIPAVNERWNRMVSGNPHTDHKQHLIKNFLKEERGLRLLSLGSGACEHELELANYPHFAEITCVDINQANLDRATAIATKENKNQMKFVCSNVEDYPFPDHYFDLVIFNDSLHHFKNVEHLLAHPIKNCLKPKGKLVIHEYVGPKRLQYPKHQLKAINKAIQLIDKPYRKRYKTNITKNHYYGSGVLRMIVADPSECVDSNNILPGIHKNFKTLEEKKYGGNILMSALKDISHHFVTLDDKKKAILDSLFKFEDDYLKENPSDFIFGVYEKPESDTL